MRGFQPCTNLPGAEKMKPGGYRDLHPRDIPVVAVGGGGQVKRIAGALDTGEGETRGPIQGGSTDTLYLDVILPAARASCSVWRATTTLSGVCTKDRPVNE
jgi:redox-sensitive bicupin YhaK (pirin superfamily)